MKNQNGLQEVARRRNLAKVSEVLSVVMSQEEIACEAVITLCAMRQAISQMKGGRLRVSLPSFDHQANDWEISTEGEDHEEFTDELHAIMSKVIWSSEPDILTGEEFGSEDFLQ